MLAWEEAVRAAGIYDDVVDDAVSEEAPAGRATTPPPLVEGLRISPFEPNRHAEVANLRASAGLTGDEADLLLAVIRGE